MRQELSRSAKEVDIFQESIHAKRATQTSKLAKNIKMAKKGPLNVLMQEKGKMESGSGIADLSG